MKTEDYQKTNEELKNEIKKNNEQIDISVARKRIARVNQLENKLISTIVLSVLSYVGLLGLLLFLAKIGILTSFMQTIPVEALSFSIAGGAVFLGAIGNKIIEWKHKIKEKLKVFSTANTNLEKLEEEVKYTIDLEKANNRKIAIQQTMDLLSSNQAILNSLSNRYEITDRTMPQTEEEAQKRVEELSLLLKERYDELDILTIQKVLHEKFWRVRSKGEKEMNMLLISYMCGVLIMFYMAMPLQVMKTLLEFSIGLPALLSPFIAGVIGTSGYMLKRNKDYIKVFNNLNKELGENALPDKIKEPLDEQREIDAKIENKIKEISMIQVQLQEQKRILEAFTTDGEEKEKTLETSVSKEQTMETTRDKNNELEYSQEDLEDPLTEGMMSQEEKKTLNLTLK